MNVHPSTAPLNVHQKQTLPSRTYLQNMSYLIISLKLFTLLLAAVSANGGHIQHAHAEFNESSSVKPTTKH